MHSWPKETRHLEKIPNLQSLQWGGDWKIAILGFLWPATNSHEKIWPDQGHMTLTLGCRASRCIYGAFLLRLSVRLLNIQQRSRLYLSEGKESSDNCSLETVNQSSSVYWLYDHKKSKEIIDFYEKKVDLFPGVIVLEDNRLISFTPGVKLLERM